MKLQGFNRIWLRVKHRHHQCMKHIAQLLVQNGFIQYVNTLIHVYQDICWKSTVYILNSLVTRKILTVYINRCFLTIYTERVTNTSE